MSNLQKLSDEELIEYHRLFRRGVATSGRFESAKIHQADTKFLYHVVRLLNEAEMILLEGDLDLLRNREQLKAIRRGEWSLQQILEYFERKRISLEEVRAKSTLPARPNMNAIRDLLLRCLESHYGTLEGCVVVPGQAEGVLRHIKEILDESGY